MESCVAGLCSTVADVLGPVTHHSDRSENHGDVDNKDVCSSKGQFDTAFHLEAKRYSIMSLVHHCILTHVS